MPSNDSTGDIALGYSRFGTAHRFTSQNPTRSPFRGSHVLCEQGGVSPPVLGPHVLLAMASRDGTLGVRTLSVEL
jgi:hypothetical protein